MLESGRTRASGTNVRLGVTLKSLSEGRDHIRVETDDGRIGDYTLLVGADGAFPPCATWYFRQRPTSIHRPYCWRLVAGASRYSGVHFTWLGP
jgi:2-polyprenyl-6-methoxyphenol hydroxylase-like FAD-dependent oxidoreductase